MMTKNGFFWLNLGWEEIFCLISVVILVWRDEPAKTNVILLSHLPPHMPDSIREWFGCHNRNDVNWLTFCQKINSQPNYLPEKKKKKKQTNLSTKLKAKWQFPAQALMKRDVYLLNLKMLFSTHLINFVKNYWKDQKKNPQVK